MGMGMGTGKGMGLGPAGSRGDLLLLPSGREQSLVLARREPTGPHCPEGLLPPLQAPCKAPGEKPAGCRTAPWQLGVLRWGTVCMGASAHTPLSPTCTPSPLDISPARCPGMT